MAPSSSSLSPSPFEWRLFFMISALKLTFINFYHSTDFEVHRNWISLTSSSPFSSWYKDSSSPSPWTLDYPPFFAFFQLLCAFPSSFLGEKVGKCFEVSNLNDKSWPCELYLSATVIVSDFVLLLGGKAVERGLRRRGEGRGLSPLSLFLLLEPSLLLVDHIHFQYNGFLMGGVLMTAGLIGGGEFFLGSAVFTALVLFKHIFVYCAPAVAALLIKHYCWPAEGGVEGRGRINTFFLRLSSLALFAVVPVSLLGLLPILLTHQFPEFLSRLFPFGRGLTHAYWAPNFWAIYVFLDRVLIKTWRLAQWAFPSLPPSFSPPISEGGATRGLAEVVPTAVLPQVPPAVCLLLTVAVYLPFLWRFLKKEGRGRVEEALLMIGVGSWIAFEFGWHVHEKAIIMVTIPLQIYGILKEQKGVLNIKILNLLAMMSLLPLLPERREDFVKFLLFGIRVVLDNLFFPETKENRRKESIFSRLLGENAYLIIVIFTFFIALFTCFFDKLGFAHLDFLPLMVCSVYSSVVLLLVFIDMYSEERRGEGERGEKKGERGEKKGEKRGRGKEGKKVC